MRVLWLYIGLLFFPSNSQLGLFHDDMVISNSIIDPVSTLFASAGIGGLLILAIGTIRRAPLIAFGVLFFLVGHAMESTIFSLEIAHEHRNYLPIYGLLLVSSFYLLTPHWNFKNSWLKQGFVIILIALLSVITFYRADYWGDGFEHSIHEAKNHPDSPRANSLLGELYADLATVNNERREYYYRLAVDRLERASELRENYTDGLFKLLALSARLQRPIREQLRLEEYDLKDEAMTAIIRHALSNPTISGRVKAELLTVASKYFWLNLHDYGSALYLIAQSAEVVPKNPKYRLHLVTLLIDMGRVDDAKLELNVVQRLDHLGQFAHKIKKYRELLSTS